MTKSKTIYQCQSCGYATSKWLGKCPDCGAWDSFALAEAKSIKSANWQSAISELKPLNEITGVSEYRIQTGISELDRTLGGGLVSGALILVGGDPGIGKSTLILQCVNLVAQKLGKVLYVSGEESPKQIKLRAERMHIASNDILILSETVIESILQTASAVKPSVIVIDSIQTIYTEDIPSASGSVSQIREATAKIMLFAKKHSIPTFLIGHVTKDGAIAGPRVLEHMVDTVLYFEGDKSSPFRILRTIKNRFGATNEIGIFEMTDEGLKETSNPSLLFLSVKENLTAGCAVVASIEGTRPLLAEIQALVAPTAFGIPKRTCMGIDYNRVNILLAVLEKKAGISLGAMDVFVNVVGGLKLIETAVDLALVASIVSSFWEAPVMQSTVLFGEVGLSGEVRAVGQSEARLKEASKVGFKNALIPEANYKQLKNHFDLNITAVKDISALLDCLRI